MSAATLSHRSVPDRPFLSMCRYNAPYWKAYTVAGILGLIFLVVGMLMPLILKAVVDGLDTGDMTRARMWNYFGLLAVIGLVTALTRFWERLLIGYASRKFEYDLRNDYFRHVQGLSREFFNRTKTGDIMARATNDLNFVRMAIGFGVRAGVDLFRIPFTLAMLLHFSIGLTGILAFAFPIAWVCSYFILKYTRRQARIVQEHFSGITSLAQENLSGARVVKAYDAGDREVKAFTKKSDIYARENLKAAAIRGLMGPLTMIVIRMTLLISIWQGGLMVMRGDVTSQIVIENGWLAIRENPWTLGDLMGFNAYLMMVSGSLAALGMVTTIYQQGAAGMNRISEILAETPTIFDGEDTDTEITSLRGGIEFKNVTFKYGSQSVLRDVSWEIHPGQTVAIVGSTGSGKSTILSLVTRQYDPSEGQVLLDGVDARHVPLAVLRTSIGLVPQDTFLFSHTIRSNLTVGRPKATDEEIMRACQIAQFDETLLEMQDGLETLLGERGVNLSGGQKQRLAIARALVQDPAILMLDDSLSSVDTRTEERILQGLKSVMAARTSVVVAHRISTVRYADLILVLDDGAIVERGSHDELLAHGGLYANMYERQALEKELEKE